MRIPQGHVDIGSRKERMLTGNTLVALSSAGSLPERPGVEVGGRGVLQG